MMITDDYNVPSPILEAYSYYPFGLQQKGIGLKQESNPLINRFLFDSGTELLGDLDVDLYETTFRSLDPQLGRFWQIDPLADYSESLSPYSYSANNPLLFNDPLGLDTLELDKNGNMPMARADETPLQDVDIVMSNDGKSTYYYNGQSWQIQQTSADVTVTGTRPSLLKRIVTKISNFFKGSDDEPTQSGGIPLVSENGGSDPTTTRALHPDRPINIDLLFLVITGYSGGKLPDNFLDVTGTAYDISTGITTSNEDHKNESEKTTAPTNKTPNLAVDPRFSNKKPNPVHYGFDGKQSKLRSPGQALRLSLDASKPDTIFHE